MESVRPSFVSLIWLVYRDAGRALWTLRHLAWTACLIGIAHALARLILYSPGFAATIGATARDLIAVMFGAGWIFLLAPFLIAVHRLVLFDEVTTRYHIEPKSPRVLRFFGCWLALALVAAVPVMLMVSALTLARLPDAWLLWAMAPLIVLPVILGLRMTLILPAIAADAPGATWMNAYQDTRGHSWGILLTYLAVEIPCVLAGVALMVLARLVLSLALLLMVRAGVPLKIVATIDTLTWLTVLNAVSVCSAVLFVALASRLFQLLGDRVKRLPGPQTA